MAARLLLLLEDVVGGTLLDGAVVGIVVCRLEICRPEVGALSVEGAVFV